jgi:hypothetical protein
VTCHPAPLSVQRRWKAGRFLVTDGGHIFEHEGPYAELEVIRMYLTSLAVE